MKIKNKKGLSLNKKGFTLIELLVATSIFLVIISASMTVFFNISRIKKYMDLSNLLEAETTLLMERLALEIEQNKIDYSEYYNFFVLQGGLDDNTEFGANFTVYASRFVNPGFVAGSPTVHGQNKAGLAPDDLGAFCFNGSTYTTTCDGVPTLEYTEDYITGTNPYTGQGITNPNDASAVCDSTTEMGTSSLRACSGFATDKHKTQFLFLISPDSLAKTIIGLENWGTPLKKTISMIKMDGSDDDYDGINENWTLQNRFDCNGTTLAKDFKNATGKSFEDVRNCAAPLAPLNLQVLDFYAFIAPIEDPNKAFGEYSQKYQPYITLVIKTTLNDPRINQLPESLRTFTLQRTISIPFTSETESLVIQ